MKKNITSLIILMMLFGLVTIHAQSLQLTAPNGGEVWVGGSVHPISWTYSNVDNIKIEYSLDNGLNWTILSASYPTSALSISWTVPCIGSNLAKVRITSTLQFTQDESNAIFTIPEPTVDISYPNGGESFGIGTGQYIEWSTSGVRTLKVQYTLNNGSTWTDIGNFTATNNYCNWIVPSTLSSQARIRAFNIESARNIDSSLVPFNIISIPSSTNDKYRGGSFDGYNMCPNLSDSIKVLTPNGGEVLSPTNTVAITWNYRHIDNIKIEFSIDNGSTWNSIVSGIPASQLSYNWTVPNSPSTQCRIKITSLLNGVNDISDAAFTINSAFVNVIYPNGGESFGTGTGQYIEWNSNSVSTVKLEYSTNNGSTWTTIGTAPAANKYANWIPPTTVTTQCLIRISDNAVPSLNDLSDASFSLFNLPTLDANKYRGGSYDGYSMNSSIRDSIRVTSPNGGETWTAASTRTIIWTYNDVDNVSIEYTLDDGLTWTTIAASVPASQLSYNWTVPTTPSFLCRIRVKDILRPISDQSDAVFVIPNSFVQILYPNGGERFGAGTGQYIEWNYNDLATIKLEYSTNNGSTWNVIGTAPAANKYANWVVPAIASNQLLIRATDLSNPIYTDQSNTVFTSFTRPTEDPNKFKGGQFDGYSMYSFKDIYVNVIRPNGGEIWGNGTTQQIRWTTLNLTENLNIEYSIDNEVNWTTLASNVSNTSGPFNWTISSPVSTICKVRAKTVSGSYFDKSDDFFTIANPNGIITDAITGNTFCSGANTTVNFTLNTAFNPGNRFIVQLSDSVGTFNGSVINIGEVTSTTPQPITVTYPQRFYVSSLYRLRVIGTNPPTLGTDNGVNFTINPLPNVNLGNDTVICPGSTIVLNAGNTATTYAWSTGASTSSIDVTQGGTYWVDVTNSCGTTRDSIVIQSRQLPSVNLGNDTLVCLNSSITLDAGTNASTYLWSTGDVSRQISVVVPGNYSVSVSNVCGTAADVIAIGNRPSAVVNLGADRGLCSGQTITLDAGNPGATYLWSTGSTTQSILVSAPGNYSVDVTDACGITSDQISIFNGAMTVNTGPDLSICSGASATLTATGANSYSWNTGQTSSSITVTPSANTTYTVIGTNIFNCTASDQIEVTVNNAPIAEIVSISGSTTYCDNNPSILTANQAAGLTYAWARNGVLIPNTNIISYLPLQSGQYAVVTTNTFGCSSTSIPVNITVLSTPQATITPSGNVTLCSGSNLQLDGNTGAGLTFQWLLNGNSINGATSAQYITGTGGSFTLSVTNADGCATISAPTNVQVNSSPVATITAAGPTTFCLGGSVLLQANTGQGLIYEWQKNGVNIPQATSVSYSATEGGVFSVIVSSSSGCTATSNGIVVSISNTNTTSTTVISSCTSYLWSVTNITYTASGTYISNGSCSSDTLILTINQSSSGSSSVTACGSYQWQGTNYAQSGTYTNTLTNAAGCDSVATLILTIIQSSTLSLTATATQIACNGGTGSISLSASGGTPSYTYGGDATTGLTAGTYNYTVTDANGCTSTTTGTITQPSALSSSSSATAIACNGENSTVTVSASGGTAPYTGTGTFTRVAGAYSYTVTDANGCTSTTTGTITQPLALVASSSAGTITCFGGSTSVTVSAAGGTAPFTGIGSFTASAGAYSYTVTDANGCTATISVTLTQPTKVEGTTTTVAASGCAVADGSATVNPTGGTGSYSYLWSNGQTSQTATGLVVGTYTVFITDGNGCTGSASAIVTGSGGSVGTPGAISGPQGACRNTTGIVYSVAPVLGATSYTWTLPSGANGTSTTNSITVSFTNAYLGGFICVTANNACGSSPQSCQNVPVIFLYPAVPAVISGPSITCGPGTYTFSTSSANATSFNWTITGTGATIATGQGTNTITVNVPTRFTQGSIQVRGVNCNGISPVRGMTITGIPAHSNAVIGPSLVCANSTATYTMPGVPGVSTYTWSITGGATLIGQTLTSTATSATFNFGPTWTSGTVTISVSNACSSFERTFAVGSTPNQPGSISGPGTALCGLSNVTYSIAAVPGATSYTWSVPTAAGASLVSTSPNGLSIAVNFTPAFTTTSANICVTANNACGVGTARCYTVTSRPAAPVISGPTSVCKSQAAVVYSVAPVASATSYLWSVTGGATIAPSGTTATVNYNTALNTSAVVRANAVNTCGASQPGRLTVAVSLFCRTAADDVAVANTEVVAFPNPTTGKATISFNSASESRYLVKVTDVIGNTLISDVVNAIEGYNTQDIELTGVAKGIYMISVTAADGNTQTLRLIVE